MWSSVSIEGDNPPCKQKICTEFSTYTNWQAHGTHLVVDQRRQGKIVEQVGEKLPHVGVSVLSQTLVVEAVNLGDLPRFVVAPENGHTVTVAEFERDEQGHRLDRVVPSIDIVAHEEVVCVGRVAADAEELREVVLRGKVSRVVANMLGLTN
jgi:hypothetical protein